MLPEENCIFMLVSKSMVSLRVRPDRKRPRSTQYCYLICAPASFDHKTSPDKRGKRVCVCVCVCVFFGG